MTLAPELSRGLEALRVVPTPAQVRKLLDYLELIRKWNRVYNLTALREPAQLLTHHVLDSLAAAPHLLGDRIVDVGSGAGLPGIPLAIVMPEVRVTLLDANQKKSAFQKQAAIELALTNVEVVNARAEAWRPAALFDVVISRAFAELARFVALAGHLCGRGGVLAAMKGQHPRAELESLPAAFRVTAVVPLDVPGLGAERHLVFMQPSSQMGAS